MLQDIASSLSNSPRRLTKSQIKKLRRKGFLPDLQGQELEQYNTNRGLILQQIKPKTINQSKIFKTYTEGKQLLLHGLPGTGKSFLSLYLALSEVLSANSDYNKVVIVRSIVPTRDIGFLPGNKAEKMAEYEAPYMAICAELFNRNDAYKNLKNQGKIEFMPTSFIRGLTFNNTIIIVDEMQNLTAHELDSVITRLGNKSRIVFCGDFRQSDLRFRDEKEGIRNFMRILDSMSAFVHIELGVKDIVRSGIVRDYIIAKADFEDRQVVPAHEQGV